MTSLPDADEHEDALLPPGSSKASPPAKLNEQGGDFTAEDDGRLDAQLRINFSLSHKRARKLISTGKVTVNGQHRDRWESSVRHGDRVHVQMSAPNQKRKESLGARLVFQDDSIVVLSKPSGLLSAPAPHSDEESALIAANRLCKGPRRPRVVHRLDKETSGLIVFARTIPAARALQESIQTRQLRRTYRCIVRGVLPVDEGYISSGLLRDAGLGRRGSEEGTLRKHKAGPLPVERPTEGKWALTHFKVIQRGSKSSALEVEIFTGRTHQIRIHLAEIGHPILGEWVYERCRKESHRLALHACAMTVPHPFKREALTLTDPWPIDLNRLQPLPKGWAKASDKGEGRSHSPHGTKA